MAKTGRPRVLLDSSALIALIKGEPGAERLDGLMEMVERGDAELVESVIVLGEVYQRSNAADEAERNGHDAKLESIRSLLESRDVLLLDVTPPIVKKATGYRQSKKPGKLPDAIHLATAVLNDCDWLVTFDGDFPDIDGLRTLRWADMHAADVSLPWDIAVQGSLFPELSNVVSLHRGDA